VNVEDHYWDPDTESFTTEPPAGIVNSDFKTMDIVVMWRGLEGGESFADHDTIDFGAGGGVRIVEAIPSTPGLLGALIAADKLATGNPPVDYHPGENPNIVALRSTRKAANSRRRPLRPPRFSATTRSRPGLTW
jgi:hypothetical protein